MHNIAEKLFLPLLGPLYKRLRHELELQIANADQATREHNANASKKVLANFLQLSYTVNGGASSHPDESGDIPDEKVARIMVDVDRQLDIIEIGRKHEISLATLIELQKRFKGMNQIGVERTRILERHCLKLSAEVASLKAEVAQFTSNSRKGPSSDESTLKKEPPNRRLFS